MIVLIILLAVFLSIFLQTFLYQKYWSTNMTAHSVFSEKAISEGETAMIEDELTNDKMLPLPWVHFKFRIKANGQTVFFENELFHILFHQRIRVKRNRTFSKRGIYQISEIDLVSYDLLLTKKLVATIPCDSRMVVYPALIDAEEMHIPYENLMGDLVTKRFTNEDSYQFKSIREYRQGDTFKRINFKASAKTGEWQVNTYEYTLEPRVLLVLLCDRTLNDANESEYERALHLAGTLAYWIEQQGIPTTLISNGLRTESGEELAVPTGCGDGHIQTIMEGLAGLHTEKIQRTCLEVLSDLESEAEKNDFIVLLSPYRREELIGKYQEMAEKLSISWISSLSENRILNEDEAEDLDKQLQGFIYDRF